MDEIYKELKGKIVATAIEKITVCENMINLLENKGIITEEDAQRKRRDIESNFHKTIEDTYRKAVMSLINKKLMGNIDGQKKPFVKKM